MANIIIVKHGFIDIIIIGSSHVSLISHVHVISRPHSLMHQMKFTVYIVEGRENVTNKEMVTPSHSPILHASLAVNTIYVINHNATFLLLTDCTLEREEGRPEFVRFMTLHVCLRLKPCLLSMQMVLEMQRTKTWKDNIDYSIVCTVELGSQMSTSLFQM